MGRRDRLELQQCPPPCIGEDVHSGARESGSWGEADLADRWPYLGDAGLEPLTVGGQYLDPSGGLDAEDLKGKLLDPDGNRIRVDVFWVDGEGR